jgi:hypothetical protein
MDTIKELKKSARGNSPSKSPGYFSDTDRVLGRDGKVWKTHRVYFTDEGGDERYELVWIKL